MNFVRKFRGLRLGHDASLDKLAVPLWPDVGKALGLSKNHTYEAARAGAIPTVKFGRTIRVAAGRAQQDAGGRREAEAGQEVSAPRQRGTERYEGKAAELMQLIASRGEEDR